MAESGEQPTPQTDPLRSQRSSVTWAHGSVAVLTWCAGPAAVRLPEGDGDQQPAPRNAAPWVNVKSGSLWGEPGPRQRGVMSQGLQPRDSEMAQGNSVEGPVGVGPHCPVLGGGGWRSAAVWGVQFPGPLGPCAQLGFHAC